MRLWLWFVNGWRWRSAAAFGLGLLLDGIALKAQRLPFAVFDTDQGLPTSRVLTSKVDRRGILWVGSSWGLSRLEADTFRTFGVSNGLPSAVVRVILEDSRGNLWLGTNRGLARYDGKSLRAVPIPELEDPLPLVWSGAVDPLGRLWFGTEQGLVRVRPGREPERVAWSPAQTEVGVYAVLAVRDRLFVGGRTGALARCGVDATAMLQDCQVWPPEAIPDSGGIRDLEVDSSGRLYLATRRQGVWVLEGSALRSLGIRNLKAQDIHDTYDLLVREDTRELWVGLTRGGILICSLDRPEPCLLRTTRNGLPSNQIRHLESSSDGSVWIASDGGLVRWSTLPLHAYLEEDGLPDGAVLAVLPGEAGSVWVGTGLGLAKLRTGLHGEAQFETVAMDSAGGVYALLKDPSGVVWVGTETGLCRLAPGSRVCSNQDLPEELRRAFVISLALAPEGALWVGVANGLLRWQPENPGSASQIERFGREAGLRGGAAYALSVDPSGRLWVAHREGLSWQVDRNRFEGWTEANQPLLGFVRCVSRSEDGNLWVGGEGFVARFVGMVAGQPRFERLDLEPELGTRAVIGIVDAGQHGWLILGTNAGVMLVDPQARGGRGGVLALWDRAAGLPGSDLAHSSALARDGSGGIWLGLQGGLARLRALPPVHKVEPPELEFVELALGEGRSLRAPFSAVGKAEEHWLEGGKVELPADARELRVLIAPRGFVLSQGLAYRFQLRGVDSDWSSPVTVPFRDYARLPPGRLKLQARTVLGSGREGPISELELRIAPYWWEHTAVRLGAVIGLGTLVIAGFAWREQIRRQQAAELARAVSERTQDQTRYARALADHLAAVDRDLEQRREQQSRETDLVARLAHDVRSPLTSLLGFSELLAASASSRLTARELRYLSTTTESAKQILRLVDDFLLESQLAARGRKLQVEPVQVAPLLASLVSLLDGLAVSREIVLQLAVAPRLGEVHSDLALLRQVILNLVSNAIKYSPDRQVVSVAADFDEAESGIWWVEVRDRGPGIPLEERAAIFNPFRRGQVASSAPGYGLGLAIARELAERLGGKIEIQDREGGGSVFRLRLPVDLQPEMTDSSLSGQESIGSSRILVFDPDPMRFAKLVVRLESAGFLAVRASEVEAVGQLLREIEPLTLVWMSEEGGTRLWGALERIARNLERQSIPLVLALAEPNGEQGYLISWDRIFPSGTPRSEIGKALESVACEVDVVGAEELEELSLSELAERLRISRALRCLLLPEHGSTVQQARWRRELTQAPPELPARLEEVLESLRRRAQLARTDPAH